MNFIDKAKVFIRAGQGGDGKLSFRQEKFVDKGGPDGGDGGRGGDVVFRASRNHNTLAAFRYQKELQAEAGQPGGKNKKHGKSGRDLVVDVPVGTVVMAAAEADVSQRGNAGEPSVLADLIDDGQEAVIARGGRGGFGNAHFTSSRRQAPRFAEKGEPGAELEATLELKMIADVGLVGLPNAGKSTLLARLSNARPEIADYPFTTLTPNLGVADIGQDASLLLADIPGLIEGAAEGKGLGHEFLRHIERTAVLLHLIDAYQDDVAEAYRTVQAELAAYGTGSAGLAAKPQIVALSKVEGLDADIIADQLERLRLAVPPGTPLYAISAAAGIGLNELLRALRRLVNRERRRAEAADEQAHAEEAGVPVLRLPGNQPAPWTVEKLPDGFLVAGAKIEQFAARTNFDNEEAVQRLRAIMKKMGIMHALVRQEIEPGQPIYIGSPQGNFVTY